MLRPYCTDNIYYRNSYERDTPLPMKGLAVKDHKTVNVPAEVHALLQKLRVKYITESGKNYTLAQTVEKAVRDGLAS